MANPVKTTQTKPEASPSLRELVVFVFYCYGGTALVMSMVLSFCPSSLDAGTQAFHSGVTGFLSLLTANSFRPKT